MELDKVENTIIVDELAGKLDYSKLSLNVTTEDVLTACEEALEYGFANVTVYPYWVCECVMALHGQDLTKVGCVIGFPHGKTTLEVKKDEISMVADFGVDEVDIVLNQALLKEYPDMSFHEVSDLVKHCKQKGLVSKIIVETCFLSEAEKELALEICVNSEADYIKTSTGFGSEGALLADVQFFANPDKNIKVKASGGIKTLAHTCQLINAGADRIGTSAAVSIVGSFKGRLG